VGARGARDEAAAPRVEYLARAAVIILLPGNLPQSQGAANGAPDRPFARRIQRAHAPGRDSQTARGGRVDPTVLARTCPRRLT